MTQLLLLPSHAQQFSIKGSDTMVVLAQTWAEAFMKSHPGVNIQVSGGGSGTGLAALMNRSTDIAASSRKIKTKEKADLLVKYGSQPMEVRTALDGVTVYVHNQNPVQELSFTQLKAIFRGEITNWKEVGGLDRKIIVYSRENNSGTYAFFKEEVLDKQDFASSALTMVGTAALINAIAEDQGGIGYGGIGYATGVNILAISKADGDAPTLPTVENVVEGKYPLARYLHFYLLPASYNGVIKDFLDWVQGPEGQTVVDKVGFFPLGPVAGKKTVETPQQTTPEPVLTRKMEAVVSAPPAVSTSAQIRVEPAPQNTSAQKGTAPGVSNAVLQEISLIREQVDLLRSEWSEPLSKWVGLQEAVAKREAELSRREQALAERELDLGRLDRSLNSREQELQNRLVELNALKAELDTRSASLAAWQDELESDSKKEPKSSLGRFFRR